MSSRKVGIWKSYTVLKIIWMVDLLFWIALQSRTIEVYAYKDSAFQGQHSGILNKIYYLHNNMYDVLDN